jgi:peptidyl-prolyl cis-trans isomerase A (cyclophilin A)
MSDLNPGLYAIIGTSLGEIICELFRNQAPATVENFVGLASGTREFVDPKTRQPAKGSFYDGLKFHRVIEGFMIQGGCPLGSGTGGPGYQFQDEFVEGLTFDRPGRLAMANSGPNTNGSQFFITVAASPWLDHHHTIFGQVVRGQDVVDKISKIPRDRNDRPKTPVTLNQVRILTVQSQAPGVSES